MLRPQVTAIIPTYNRAKNVRRAVESVLAQEFAELEVIVVDDGSTDDTPAALHSFGEAICYIRQENKGPGAARNTGAIRARGEWLAFLDSDDVWNLGKLNVQLAAAKEAGADMCFHDVSRGEPDRPGFIPRWTASDQVRSLLGQELKTGLIPDPFCILIRAAHAFLTTTLLMRREVYHQAGGMREWLLTNQDIDLYLRLFPRCKVAFVAEALAAYSPGSARAFEVASKKAGGDRRGQGLARVHLDRSRALLLAVRDRSRAGDSAGLALCLQALAKSLRNLAGTYWRNGMLWPAFRSYSFAFGLEVAPVAMSSRRSQHLTMDAALKWPGVLSGLEHQTISGSGVDSVTGQQPV